MGNITSEKVNEFGKELEHLINRHSMENSCDTPDFILTAFILDCLQAFAKATKRREEWYGRKCGNGSAIASSGPSRREDDQ